MKIVTVIPLQKGPLREELTYFTAKDIPNGSIVTIPLRNKQILGMVINIEDVSEAKSDIKEMNFNLRKIIDVKEDSILRKEYLDAIILSAKYFAISKNNIATSLIPAILRENYDSIVRFISSEARPNMLGLASLEIPKKIKSEKLLFQAPVEDRTSTYKTMIRESFAGKRSIFMVLPTERDVLRWSEILGKGIEQFTFFIHGGLSSKKMMEQLQKIIITDHPILILGTAPFLSIPRGDVGTIIIEHESSPSYRTIGKPHFDLRTFTEIFASNINAKLVLSDTLLRFETIARESNEGLGTLHPLSFRINLDQDIRVENPRVKIESQKNKEFKIFSGRSIKEIETALTKKKNVFIFSLRKGLATMTICRDCAEMLSCEKCSAPLVLYISHESKKRMFVCNKCAEERGADLACERCGGWNLIPLGIGTDTVYEEIIKYFPKEKIYKLDKETAKTASGAEKIIKEFEEGKGSILIGTEMALFYMNKSVPLSLIASFDSLSGIPSFKTSEKILQLVINILKCTTHEIIIQTKNENDPAILAVQSGNLLSFIREELEDRKKLNYPPWKRFIKITHLGDRAEATKARKILKEIFQDYEPEIFSGFVAKLKGKYTTNALIKIDPKKWSLPEISLGSSIDEDLLERLLSLPPPFEVFVDPEDLL